MFQKGNAVRCDIGLFAQGTADQGHDQKECKVPRRLPCFTRAVENGITSRPVDVPPNQARGNRSSDSPFPAAKPSQPKDGHRVKQSEPDRVIRDEIDCRYNEQRRRHLGDDQGRWLSRKVLCEIHLNKFAWCGFVEQADLPRVDKDGGRSCLSRWCLYKSTQNRVKTFLKMFHNCKASDK